MNRSAYLQAWREAHPDRQSGYSKKWRATMRDRGLCIDCAEISVKYARCLACRALAQKRAKARRRERTRLQRRPAA